MSGFKVGDKVRRMYFGNGANGEIYVDGTYTVKEIYSDGFYTEEFPSLWCYDKYFELVERNNIQEEASSPKTNQLRKGDKFDSGKPPMKYLTTEFLNGTALAQEYGAKKYNPWNFQKGLEYSSMYDACIRHMTEWFHGDTNDKESGLNHLFHAAANLNMLIWMEANKPAMDDRPKKLTEDEKFAVAEEIQKRGR